MFKILVSNHFKMTRQLFILTVFLGFTALTGFQNANTTTKYDWTKIKEFKFYGFINPADKKDAKYILADTDTIEKIFSNLKKSDGFIPKGASRFATITFDSKKKITIQIIAGGHLPFRVIKKDILSDDWFDFDDSRATEWTTYISELTDKIEK